MTDIFYHSAPSLARDLTRRLDGLLRELQRDESSRLRRMLVLDEHERPRMVFTGQYSSGKSTLIKALTDEAAQVVIDSAVATDKVELFDWDGLVDLVDTPGVQAGFAEHDALAEEALQTADLILFTVTVDLFDDRSVEHLRRLTEDLRKAPQLLVVVTKCRSLAAAEGVREAAVRDALGRFAEQVPWVECDAKTYLDGLHEDDPSRATRRIEASRMTGLRNTINRIARERGELARFRVPLQQVALVAGEALAVLTEDSKEEAVLTVLARQRSALTNRRGLLDSALDRLASEFRTACIRAAEHLAESAESIEESPNPEWSKLEAASDKLNEALNQAGQRLADGVRGVLNSQLADLTSEVREIEASPYAHRLKELGVRSIVELEDASIDSGLVRGPDQRQARGPVWGPKAIEYLEKFQQYWGAGDGVKQAAGSRGHKIVYSVGKRINVKFKPYQAVRWANNVGRAVRAGSVLLPVALEGYAVVSEERQEEAAVREKMRRRNALIGEVLAQTDVISSTALTPVRVELDAEFGAAIREIDGLSDSVHENRSNRSTLDREIRKVQIEAQSMLDRLELS